MKKLTALAAALAIVLSLTSCSEGGGTSETQNTSTKPTTEKSSEENFKFLEDLAADVVTAETASVSDFKYDDYEDFVAITRYLGDDTEVVISAEINGKLVSEIGVSRVKSGGHIPFDDNIIKVTLPDSLTSIGALAFTGCKELTSINLPEGVTVIGDSAFKQCYSLESVTIPDSVKKRI